MNGKLEKLIKKATKKVKAQTDMGDHYTFEQFDQEKFIELVVNECADVADEGYGSANFGNGITGNMLKEHFGLEIKKK